MIILNYQITKKVINVFKETDVSGVEQVQDPRSSFLSAGTPLLKWGGVGGGGGGAILGSSFLMAV